RDGTSSRTITGLSPSRYSRRQLGVEHAVHAVPVEISQRAAQFSLHASQIGVMTHPALQRKPGLDRLTGIDLPGMEVEDAGFAVFAVDGVHRRRPDAVRQEAEIAAAAARPVASQ